MTDFIRQRRGRYRRQNRGNWKERMGIKMLRWTMGIALKDHLRNEVRGRAGMECITEVMEKTKIRVLFFFSYVTSQTV